MKSSLSFHDISSSEMVMCMCMNYDLWSMKYEHLSLSLLNWTQFGSESKVGMSWGMGFQFVEVLDKIKMSLKQIQSQTIKKLGAHFAKPFLGFLAKYQTLLTRARQLVRIPFQASG